MVGIGEPLQQLPGSLEEAIGITGEEHGEKAGRMLRRFAGLLHGSFVWTQTAPTTFRLGKITGPWCHDSSRASRRTGIRNVRPACWIETVFDAESAPAAVVATFGRGGRNLQAISDLDAVRSSQRLWEEHKPAALTSA